MTRGNRNTSKTGPFDSQSKRAKLHLFVAKRFLLKCRGTRTTMEEVKKLLSKVDLKALAALAK